MAKSATSLHLNATSVREIEKASRTLHRDANSIIPKAMKLYVELVKKNDLRKLLRRESTILMKTSHKDDEIWDDASDWD